MSLDMSLDAISGQATIPEEWQMVSARIRALLEEWTREADASPTSSRTDFFALGREFTDEKESRGWTRQQLQMHIAWHELVGSTARYNEAPLTDFIGPREESVQAFLERKIADLRQARADSLGV